MKVVAALVNLFIASVYVAIDGGGCVLAGMSFFHIACSVLTFISFFHMIRSLALLSPVRVPALRLTGLVLTRYRFDFSADDVLLDS